MEGSAPPSLDTLRLRDRQMNGVAGLQAGRRERSVGWERLKQSRRSHTSRRGEGTAAATPVAVLFNLTFRFMLQYVVFSWSVKQKLFSTEISSHQKTYCV